jgi:SAM-dependent methyltransferase
VNARFADGGPGASVVATPTAPPPREREIPDDFRTLDFGALWKGRDRTTEVESALVRSSLARFASERVLELGTGEGRLSPTARESARQYIGVDQSFEFLRRSSAGRRPDPNSLLVEANLYHLPFVDGVATAALLARVYNFLTDPSRALAEIRRTLVLGGGLVLSCHARPSAMTLIDDIRSSLDPSVDAARPILTFNRADVVPAIPSPFPAFVPTRRYLRRTIHAAGFRREGTLGSGFEDYRGARLLPARVFFGAGVSIGAAPGFPLVWEVLRNGPALGPTTVPPLASCLACPRCRRPFGAIDLAEGVSTSCPACEFEVRVEAGILRARYVAE